MNSKKKIQSKLIIRDIVNQNPKDRLQKNIAQGCYNHVVQNIHKF